MTAGPVAIRARGREAHVLAEDALAEIERAGDLAALARAFDRAALVTAATPDAVERAVRGRIADDLAVLGRWARDRPAALAAIALDEDRRSLRAIARGLAAGAAPERRRDGCVPTASLPEAALAALAAAPTLAALARELARRAHPLAPAIPAAAAGAIDLLGLELALARRYAEVARASVDDPALGAYVGQLLDGENAATALLLAARGAAIAPARAFLDGGVRLPRAAFVAAATGPLDVARAQLARAFAGTPVAAAVDAAPPGALEDAVLAWQLATQARLRRVAPHGLAAVLHLVLRRRAEVRRLRRAAWRLALGGGR